MHLVSNLKNIILEEDFKITYIKNKIGIINYQDITSFNSNKIIISYKDGNIFISGENLVVSKLVKDELLIEGKIEKIELR